MALAIRAAAEADLIAIRFIHRSSIREVCGPFYTPDEISAWLDALSPERYSDMLAQRHVLVAQREDELVGFGTAELESGTVNAVYVAPQHVGDGVGRRLVAALEEALSRASIERVQLHSTLNAVSFYAGLGYASDGPAQNELSTGVSLPCVAMHRTLTAHT